MPPYASIMVYSKRVPVAKLDVITNDPFMQLLFWEDDSIRGYYTPKQKTSMFCAPSQYYQHLFEKIIGLQVSYYSKNVQGTQK